MVYARLLTTPSIRSLVARVTMLTNCQKRASCHCRCVKRALLARLALRTLRTPTTLHALTLRVDVFASRDELQGRYFAPSLLLPPNSLTLTLYLLLDKTISTSLNFSHDTFEVLFICFVRSILPLPRIFQQVLRPWRRLYWGRELGRLAMVSQVRLQPSNRKTYFSCRIADTVFDSLTNGHTTTKASTPISRACDRGQRRE